MTPPIKNGLKISSPATYRIGVQGSVHKSWSDRFSDMRIYTQSGVDEPPVTTLVGRIRDQAELFGILNGLYDMHFPILFVELLPTKRGSHRTSWPYKRKSNHSRP